MDGAKCKVKRKTPVSQIGKVGEGVSRILRPAMAAIPAKDGEQGCERVERQHRPTPKENAWRKNPRRYKSACRIKGSSIRSRGLSTAGHVGSV